MGHQIFKLNELARTIKVVCLLITGICWLLLFMSIQPVERVPTKHPIAPATPGKNINSLTPEKNNNNELAYKYQ